MSRARRFLIPALAGLVLLIAAVAATALLIPGDRVAAAVAARAEAMLGQRVRIEDVRLHFFPLPGVRLDRLTIGGTDGNEPLATARAVELRARVLPLLRGRVVLSSLALDEPRLLVRVDSAGGTNIPVLEGADEDAGESVAPERDGGREIAFAIERLDVAGGRISLHDQRDGSRIDLDGWHQRLRIAGALREGALTHVELTGMVAFDDVDATLPRVVVPVRDLSVRLTHDATLDLAADRLDLRQLTMSLEEISLSGTGMIDAVSSPEARTAALRLEADGFDAARLFALATDSVRARLRLPDGRALEPMGTAALRLDVAGPLVAGALPGFDGTLSLDGAGVEVAGEALAGPVLAEVVFSADSAVLRASGLLLGERFDLAAAVRDPASPVAVLAFSGRADLQRLRPLRLLPDSLDLTGAARADVRALVPLGAPGDSRATGTIQLSDARLDGSTPELAVPGATLTLDGRRLRIDPLMLRVGGAADVRLRAEVDGWIPALVDSGAPPPTVVADLEADTLDLDALLGPPEGGQYPPLLFARLGDRPLDDGRTAAATAEDAGLHLPAMPSMDAELRVRLDRLVRGGLAYDDVDATVHVHPAGAELLAATFRLLGGTIRASGSMAPIAFDSAGAPNRARLDATYALTGVGAAPFFDRLTPFRDHLSGDLAMAGSFAMDLDRHALPDRTTVSADGTAAISDGRLASWRVLQAAVQRLDLPARDTIRFRDWAGNFRVTGPLVTLEETALDGAELSARAAGSFDFSGQLDLGATLYLSRDLASRAGAVGEQVMAAAGSDGRIPVGLTITGSARSPDIALDFSAARETAVARAREAAQEEARQLAARAEDAALDRLAVPDSLRGLPADSLRRIIGDSLFELLPDSLRIDGDSLRAEAGDALRSRLRSLFGGG